MVDSGDLLLICNILCLAVDGYDSTPSLHTAIQMESYNSPHETRGSHITRLANANRGIEAVVTPLVDKAIALSESDM